MPPTDRARRRAWTAFGGLALGGIVAALVAGPLPQPAWFHDFADRRPWLGVPNAADVLSNVPLLVVAVLAFVALAKRTRGAGSPPAPPSASSESESSIRGAFLVYAIALAATAVGSAVYHLDPNDSSLVWDRLPLAPTFGAIAAMLLIERLAIRRGAPLLAALVVVTTIGALAWAWTLRLAPGGC